MGEDKKPKVEGGARSRNQRRGNQRESRGKEYRSEVQALEAHTFDVGAAKYAAKFTKSLEEISNYVQKEYSHGGGVIGQAIRDLVAPNLDLPDQPQGTAAHPGDPNAVPPIPARAAAPPTPLDIFMWQEDYKEAKKAATQYNENMQRSYALVWGQCSPELRNKVKAAATYAAVSAAQDVVQLLLLIRGFCCSFDDQRQGTWALQQAKKKAYLYVQKEGITNTAYMEEFVALIKVVETYGGEWGQEPGLISAKLQADSTVVDRDNPTQEELDRAKDTAREDYLAMMFLSGADKSKYWALRNELSNDYAKGIDNYPSTLDGMLRLLNNYRSATMNTQRPDVTAPGSDGVAFLQEKGCWHCKKPGHNKSDCPELRALEQGADSLIVNPGEGSGEHVRQGVDNLNVGLSMLQGSDNADRGPRILKSNHLYVDTCATYASTPYPHLLSNISKQGGSLVGHGNAGSTVMDQTGTLEGLGEVWLNKTGIANIVPFAELIKIVRVTFDSGRSNKFTVHTKEGPVELSNNEAGMPYIDLDKCEERAALCFVQTIRQSYEGYTKREVEAARRARELQAMIGHPPDREFRKMVSSNRIPNCPITVEAVEHSNKLFGPDLAGVRGRTVRTKPDHVHVEYASIPRAIMERFRNVTLAVDLMFVDGVPFLLSVSRGINLITSEFTPLRTAKRLAEHIKNILRIYARAGIVVSTVLMDNEFEKLTALLPTLVTNSTAAREHVSEIERRIRTVKERGRGVKSVMPFKGMPKLMLIEMISFVVMWLNAFPLQSGISQDYSPREIVLRTKLTFEKHCKLPFGEYVEAHDHPNRTNDSTARTTPAISMGPTGNSQGTYKFYSLITGKKIKRRKWTRLPMPDSVIRKIERHAARDGRLGNLAFADRHGDLFAWNDAIDEEFNEKLVVEDTAPFPEIPAEFPGVTLERDIVTPTAPIIDEDDIQGIAEHRAAANAGLLEHDGAPDQPVLIPEDVEAAGVGAGDIDVGHPADDDGYDDGIVAIGHVAHAPYANQDVIVVEDADEDAASATNAGNASAGGGDDAALQEWDPGDNTDDVSDDDDSNVDDSDADDYQQQPQRTRREGAGTRKPRLYDEYTFFSKAEKMQDAKPIPRDEWEDWAIGMALVQYSINTGLKKFGVKGEAAVTKELKQLHDMITFFPLDPDGLTPEVKRKAIASLMFLKEKRDGEIKGRACADGRKQREDFTKEDATSPTVSTEALFLTALIDALERRDVACFDIPGAFLHAETDEEVVMLLKGRLAELMVMVDPSLYRKYVTVNSKKESMLYVKMHKALYGMLRSALLFYRKLVADLEEDGFKINSYDPCVANRVVEGTQQTVCWHVDDLKASHNNPEVNSRFGRWLVEKYGNCKEHRGKHHDYLGMDFDWSEPGIVKIRMVPYLRALLEEFPEQITSTRATPAADYLFKVREEGEAKLLPEEQAVVFHRFVAKLVWVQARGRRDIQTAVSFLMTRVKAPDEDDWGKLKRVLQYIKGTLYMPLVLSGDSITMPKWWIDSSYAVHPDCKGHTGAMLGFGRGMPVSFAHKHRLNVRSSTEAEIVGVDDAMSKVTWTRYFLQAQGYTMEPTLIYQDNMSAMLLEQNGRASSSKRTKHINVRYFFVKDKIDKGEVKIQHCPTEIMWADMNTKPRQGRGFMIFRSNLMGIEIDFDDVSHRRDWEGIQEAKEQENKARLGALAKGAFPMKAPAMTKPSPQECVDASANKNNVAVNVGANFKKRPSSTSPLGTRTEHPGPVIIRVQGRRWSKNIYVNAREAGLSVDRAWLAAFL